MGLLKLAARGAIAAYFLSEGLKARKRPAAYTPVVREFCEPLANYLVQTKGDYTLYDADVDSVVVLNANLQIGFAATYFFRIFPKISAWMLASTMVPTAYAGQAFWKVPKSNKSLRASKRNRFIATSAVLAGTILSESK